MTWSLEYPSSTSFRFSGEGLYPHALVTLSIHSWYLVSNEAAKTRSPSTSILRDLLSCWLVQPKALSILFDLLTGGRAQWTFHGQEDLIVVYREEIAVIETELADEVFHRGFAVVRPLMRGLGRIVLPPPHIRILSGETQRGRCANAP